MSNHIQIGDVTPRIQYAADGIQTQFSYPFPIFVEDNLEVYTGDTKEVSGYSVIGAGTSYGGSVVFDEPPASGVVVTLRRSLSINRTTDFQQSGAFRAKDINDEFDYLTAALQQVADDVGRAVHLSSTDEDTDLELPSKDERANKVLGFDASGDVIATSGSGGSGGGATDHGQLTGLSDDDHGQYHNDTRGDARYYTQGQVDTALGGKSDTNHNHDSAYVPIAHVSDTANPHSVTAAQAGALPTGTKLDDLAAPDDNTDLDASTDKHGLLPKLSGSATEYLDGQGNFTTPSGGGTGGLSVLAPHTTTSPLNLSADTSQTATAVPLATTLPAISATDRQVVLFNRSGSAINVASNGSDTIRVGASTGQTTVAVPNNTAVLFHVDSGQTEWQAQIVTDDGEANTISSAGTGTSIVASTPKVGGDLQVRGLASPGGTITIAPDNPNENINLTVNSVPESAVTAHQGALTVSRTNVPAIDVTASRTMNIANDLGTRQEGFIRMSQANAQYNVVKNIAAVGQRFIVQWTNATPSQATPFTNSSGGCSFVPSSMPAIDTQYQTLCLLCVDATTDANIFQILPAAL
jgi:hypothetical protein